MRTSRAWNEAMEEREAPFYLRRVKEALVTFPDSETGEVRQLFTRRNVRTAPFQLNADEVEFYDDLTRYVEDQSIRASEDDSARGRALGFTMAMLQRRFASSVYAVRRSLERMRIPVRRSWLTRKPTARSRSIKRYRRITKTSPTKSSRKSCCAGRGRPRRRPGRTARGNSPAGQTDRPCASA